MTAGYVGKILRLNLTNRSTSIIDTEQYEEWGGGTGMGSAIFWDLCQDKTINGFDPRNVVTIMPSPLSGTLVPGVGRTEVNGIGVYGYPTDWFTRSNFGGSFGSMLRFAGWDGIAIEGKADKPVWVNIINDKVTIEDANGLWGLDTYATQEEIRRRVTGRSRFGEWMSLGDTCTTLGPDVLCIGPAGENLSRLGILLHGCGSAAGQGGFGGIWGSKNLKAISVIGTGSIKIADPKALMEARAWFVEKHQEHWVPLIKVPPGGYRLSSCQGCTQLCKLRQQSGERNDGMCAEALHYADAKIPIGKKSPCEYYQMYGINIYEDSPEAGEPYLEALCKKGILGPGKEIDSDPLPIDKIGTTQWSEELTKAIAYREGIGADLAEGIMRAAKKWGRLEEDLTSGILDMAQWGYRWHWGLPEVSFAYGSLMGDRDTNEHCWQNLFFRAKRIADRLPAEKLVQLLAQKTIPYTGDPFMFDYSTGPTGIYSKHKAKFIAWHRHYTRFWKESIQFCDVFAPMFINRKEPDFSGFTPEGETKFFNAVTGKNMSFADGMEIGRKIWNLNRAIWVLQGRHREMEKFAEFMYTQAGGATRYFYVPLRMGGLTVYKDGKWCYDTLEDLCFDKAGVEQWKTNFYEFEGWDIKTGWPTRKALEEMELRNVADTLEDAGRLGSPT